MHDAFKGKFAAIDNGKQVNSSRQRGSEATVRINLDAMMQSCARFIDFDRIDVLPTSQYRF